MLLMLALTLAAATGIAAQTPVGCGTPIEREHTVCQRCYERLDAPSFKGKVYVYTPDIRSRVFGGYEPFSIWIVEGIYGPPFLDAGGVFDEAKFNQLAKTRNVVATQVPVDNTLLGKARPFKVGKDGYRIELTHVHTSYGGTDSVSFRICR